MSLHPTIAANVEIPGAGAVLRQEWPSTQSNVSTGSAAKFGISPLNPLSSLGGVSPAQTLYGGAACAQFPSAAADTYSGLTFATNISFYTERTGGAVLDSWSCWSLKLTAAFPALAADIDMDVGIVLGCGGTSSLNYGAVNGPGTLTQAGLIFGPTGNGHIALRARAVIGGAETISEQVAAALTPDLTKFNTFEVQFITGSASTDPVVFGLVNGVVVTARYALTAAAGLFPNPLQGSGSNKWGYSYNFLNRSAGNYANVYMKKARLTAAQNAAALF